MAAETYESRVLALTSSSTVDPHRNELARLAGWRDVARPDRLIMYTPNYWGHVVGVELVGAKEIGSQAGFFGSAHYGVAATVRAGGVEEGVVQKEESACVIM